MALISLRLSLVQVEEIDAEHFYCKSQPKTPFAILPTFSPTVCISSSPIINYMMSVWIAKNVQVCRAQRLASTYLLVSLRVCFDIDNNYAAKAYGPTCLWTLWRQSAGSCITVTKSFRDYSFPNVVCCRFRSAHGWNLSPCFEEDAENFPC